MRSIDIRYSSNNTVVDNNIAMSGVNSIFLEYSSNNTLARNSITGCQYGSGIDFYTTSSYNLVTENTIADNKYGITLTGGSSNNIILHNNFINNTIQVYSYSSTNEWDDGYPLGGNYWSNYTGGDLYSGIHQNETGSDGMGDAPYIIGSDSADHYPLMTPWSQLQGDMNYDRVVNILDIVAISSIYHCQEGEPNWNPEADLAPPYGIINMLDLVTCAYHYGEKYP
jgi:parallel beta-helix repeat protein